MKKLRIMIAVAALLLAIIIATAALFLGQAAVMILVGTLLVALLSLPLLLDAEKVNLCQKVRSRVPGRFVELPEGFVHYDLAGPDTGQVVVLIHGFSIPYYVWDPTFEILKTNGFRVLRYDLFGRGFSERPKVTYDRWFFEVQLRNLLDALKINEPVDLIGLSIGAAIGSGFAASCPQRVRRLVFISPHHEGHNISLLAVPVLGEYLAAAFIVPSLPKRQMENFYRPERFVEWPDLFYEQMVYNGFRRALLSTLRNFVSLDHLEVYQQVGKLNKPVLLIWGKEDKTAPISGNERIRRVLKVNFLPVDKAAHLAYYERPDIVYPELINFLSCNDP
jgi:pimeloyl-ACP methyl ester carboxylesterase